MPDISMCKNETCELRHDCYRHEAEVTWPRGQSWAEYEPNEDGTCDHFLEIWAKECRRCGKIVKGSHTCRPIKSDELTRDKQGNS